MVPSDVRPTGLKLSTSRIAKNTLVQQTQFPWLEKGVLIYGPRKGGTTLLQNLLDGGEEVFVYPTELKLKVLIREVMAATDARSRYNELSVTRKRTFPNFNAEKYGSAMDLPGPSGDRTLADLLGDDIAKAWGAQQKQVPKRPRMWAIKEVGGDARAIISAWRNLNFDNRIVLIMRDPRMVTRSVVTERRRRNVKLGAWGLFQQVLETSRNLYHQLDLIGMPGVFAITYEDLVADPVSMMKKVAGFLGIENSPAFHTPSIFGEPVVTSTASVQTKDVFHVERNWYDDLTFFERLVVGVSYQALCAALRLVRKRKGRNTPDYASIRANVLQALSTN